MTRHLCYLWGWSAWAPNLPENEDWIRYFQEGSLSETTVSKPKCAEAPAMMRRRFSMPTRMAFETACRVCKDAAVDPASTQLFYGSANGEIATLGVLLSQLTDREELSPTAFSNTVHHVPTGHIAMVKKHKGLSRTMSAFEETFSMLCLDMICKLAAVPQKPALLLIADEALNPPFDQMLKPPIFPYGAALLFGKEPNSASGPALTLEYDPLRKDESPQDEPTFAFLKWIAVGSGDLELSGPSGTLTWRRGT